MKCDEKLPVCARCRLREKRCVYINTPVPPELQIYELSLMHQFCTETYISVSRPNQVQIYTHIIPSLALRSKQNFLLHSLLALTASHLRYLNPSERIHKVKADSYRQLALEGLRKSVSLGITTANGEEVLAAAILMTVEQFTLREGGSADGKWGGINEGWFPLFHGLRMIVESMWSWINRSIFAPFEPRLLEAIPFEDVEIVDLRKVCEDLDPDEAAVYKSAVVTLTPLLSMLESKSATETLEYVIAWVLQLPADFVGLLRVNDDRALIILAHYFKLLGSLRNVWWLDGFAQTECTAILKTLSEPWRSAMKNAWAFDDVESTNIASASAQIAGSDEATNTDAFCKV